MHVQVRDACIQPEKGYIIYIKYMNIERSNSPVKLGATGCYPLQKSWLASVASLLQLPPKAHLENGRQNSAQCHRVGECPAFHQYVQADLGKGTPTHWQRCFHPKWIYMHMPCTLHS